MSRPSFDEIYMRLAFEIAKRSTCARLQVGCVIADIDGTRVLSVGYNGNYKEGPNTCDSDEKGNCGCLHAEDNASIKLNYGDLSVKVAYVTHLPCKMCAKRLVNAGISKIVFCEPYRKLDAYDICREVGIPIKQLVVDHE